MQGFFRADEAYCRYGGEEFAFTVVIEKAADLEIITARLINGIRDLKVSVNGHDLSVTASAGFKLCHPSYGVDFEKEMKQADVALYQSKKNGKNRATILK